jgi:hypothetical protein
MKKETELPPAAFTNKINALRHDGTLREGFDFREWRKSPEWKIFVSGYNHCVEECNAKITGRYNLGETAHRIFGGDER